MGIDYAAVLEIVGFDVAIAIDVAVAVGAAVCLSGVKVIYNG